MKKRMKRYQEGGDVDYDLDESPESQEVERSVRYTGIRASETPTTSRRSAKTAPAAVSKKTETVTMTPRAAGPEAEEVRGTMARPGRMGFRRDMPSAAQKEEFAKRFADTAMTGISAATGAGLARSALSAAKSQVARDIAAKGAREMFGSRRAAEEFARMGGMKKGGAVKKKYASGGSVSSASKRADGIAQRGKTKGRVL
ncbi:hypothetical protein EBT31_18750 [bacterium]|jgi:hypothetical protein|nr:hypothetical protein [bacterium]